MVLDVHGVLTTGAILYNDEGVKFQTFHHDDGFGANALMMLGVQVALMTRKSKIVEIRAAEVGIKHVFQAKDKTAKLQEVAEEMGLRLDEIAFVGDEIIDLGVMRMVGFAVAPANACREAKEAAHYVTEPGGRPRRAARARASSSCGPRASGRGWWTRSHRRVGGKPWPT